MNSRKLTFQGPLAASFAVALLVFTALPSAPSRAQQQEEEERLPDEAEDEFAVLDGIRDADIPMTFKFKDMPLRTIFDVIGDMAGLAVTYGDNFPFDRKASLNLPSSTLSAALKTLARTHKLRYTIQEDDSLLVNAR